MQLAILLLGASVLIVFMTWWPGCIPRPFRRRNPAESHLSISSRQGFWRRNLVHCALAAFGGASDHKFSKYDGMEAVVFFTLLFSALFLGLSPEPVITMCSSSLSSTPPNWHWRQILLCPHPWRKYPAERKNGMHYGMVGPQSSCCARGGLEGATAPLSEAI